MEQQQQQQPSVMQAHQQLHWLQQQEEEQGQQLPQAPRPWQQQQRVLGSVWGQQPWQQVRLPLPLEPWSSLCEPAVVVRLMGAAAARTGLCQALSHTSRPLSAPPLPSLTSTRDHRPLTRRHTAHQPAWPLLQATAEPWRSTRPHIRPAHLSGCLQGLVAMQASFPTSPIPPPWGHTTPTPSPPHTRGNCPLSPLLLQPPP